MEAISFSSSHVHTALDRLEFRVKGVASKRCSMYLAFGNNRIQPALRDRATNRILNLTPPKAPKPVLNHHSTLNNQNPSQPPQSTLPLRDPPCPINQSLTRTLVPPSTPSPPLQKP